MDRRPTIIDVAKEASISKSTVSLVLQNSPMVKQETRAEVRAAMDRIGYVYNRSAANLRNAKTGLIGLVINDLRNPFFTEFAASFQGCLADRDYAVVLADIQEDAVMQCKMIGTLIEHGVSGFVISPAYGGGDELPFAAIERAGLPAIQVFRQVDTRGALFPFIAPDYARGSRAAVEHLLDRSKGKIAFVGGLEDRLVTLDRMSGYLALMAARRQDPITITGATGFEFGFNAAETLKTAHPDVDAVLCFNDQVALGLISGANRLGIDGSRDLRIVGFDDIEGWRQSVPQLTSVSCGIPEFASRISDHLFKWIETGEVPRSGVKRPRSI